MKRGKVTEKYGILDENIFYIERNGRHFKVLNAKFINNYELVEVTKVYDISELVRAGAKPEDVGIVDFITDKRGIVIYITPDFDKNVLEWAEKEGKVYGVDKDVKLRKDIVGKYKLWDFMIGKAKEEMIEIFNKAVKNEKGFVEREINVPPSMFALLQCKSKTMTNVLNLYYCEGDLFFSTNINNSKLSMKEWFMVEGKTIKLKNFRKYRKKGRATRWRRNYIIRPAVSVFNGERSFVIKPSLSKEDLKLKGSRLIPVEHEKEHERKENELLKQEKAPDESFDKGCSRKTKNKEGKVDKRKVKKIKYTGSKTKRRKAVKRIKEPKKKEDVKLKLEIVRRAKNKARKRLKEKRRNKIKLKKKERIEVLEKRTNKIKLKQELKDKVKSKVRVNNELVAKLKAENVNEVKERIVKRIDVNIGTNQKMRMYEVQSKDYQTLIQSWNAYEVSLSTADKDYFATQYSEVKEEIIQNEYVEIPVQISGKDINVGIGGDIIKLFGISLHKQRRTRRLVNYSKCSLFLPPC